MDQRDRNRLSFSSLRLPHHLLLQQVESGRRGLGSNRARSCQSELRVCLLSDYAKTIAEWIAAKRDGRAFSTFEFLLAFRASVQRLDQDPLKIADMEIDVNRGPVPLISANVVRPLRRFGSCSFLNQADLGAATFENDVCRDRSSDFDKTQCITIKS
jgi:hypothetical protein